MSNSNDKHSKDNRTGYNMGFGIALGIAIGAAMHYNIALGLVVGIIIGGIGIAINKRRQMKKDDSTGTKA